MIKNKRTGTAPAGKKKTIRKVGAGKVR
jgi:hypothetical protein